MRPRIKAQKLPVLVYTTSQDKEKQSLAKFNRKCRLHQHGYKRWYASLFPVESRDHQTGPNPDTSAW